MKAIKNPRELEEAPWRREAYRIGSWNPERLIQTNAWTDTRDGATENNVE
jgi:hypothetical protein